MKVLILDPLPGMSGDMFLAGAAGLGLKLEKINSLLRRTGFKARVSLKKVKSGHLEANQLEISPRKLPHLELEEMLELIEKLKLPSSAKKISFQILKSLLEVEKKLHPHSSRAHLEEIASLDTLIDAIGAGLSISELGIEACFVTGINLPRYYRKNSKYPSPAPATLELLKGFKLRYLRLAQELITPTGASIIKTLCKKAQNLATFVPIKISYASGEKKLSGTENLFRLILAEIDPQYLEEAIYLLETALDDIAPEVLSYVQERLYQAGALEVYLSPYYGKKNRIGFKFEILAKEDRLNSLLELLLRETPTLGIRYRMVSRIKLPSQIKSKNTSYGRVRVKISSLDGESKIKPEFEDCKKIAQKLGIPLYKLLKEITNELNA